MPYKVVAHHPDCPANKPFAVVNKDTGDKHGCHADEAGANEQMRALYANVPDAQKSLVGAFGDFLKSIAGLIPDQTADVDFGFDTQECPTYPQNGVVPVEDDSDFMAGLAKNQHKRIRGVDYTANDFAIVRDVNRPQTWGILLADGRPGNISEKSLARAAQMLEPGSSIFKALGLSPEELTGAKRKIRAWLKRLSVAPEKWPGSLIKGLELDTEDFLCKQTDQGLRWFASYSTNALDMDWPPDILSEQAHKAFAYLVKEGLAPYPELWFWHLPGTRLGVADLVDQVDGIAYATGLVDKGAEPIVKALPTLGPLGVSHGMPVHLRRADDKRVVDFYISREISVLPRERAANPNTVFMIQGDTMLNDEQRIALKALQFEDARIDQIDQALATINAAADQTERKEIGEAPDTPAPDYVTRPQLEEMIGVLADQFSSIQTRLDAADTSALELKKSLDLLARADETKVAEKAAMTPVASLSDLYKQLAITSPANIVKSNSALAKDGPEETKVAPKPITGISYIDNILAGQAH